MFLGINLSDAINNFWERADKLQQIVVWLTYSILMGLGTIIALLIIIAGGDEQGALYIILVGSSILGLVIATMIPMLYINGEYLVEYAKIKQRNLKDTSAKGKLILGGKYLVVNFVYAAPVIISTFVYMLVTVVGIIISESANEVIGVLLIFIATIPLMIISFGYGLFMWLIFPLQSEVITKYGFKKALDLRYMYGLLQKHRRKCLTIAVVLFIINIGFQFVAQVAAYTIILIPLIYVFAFIYGMYIMPHIVSQATKDISV
ncbi:DUF4013 domain-containing protein [Candidatus Dojkabacteria bacterium]|uniref:DUF4013 domain-containing protein n=1 Tax=Candidatus Dojkabacteria bacterium TaxID=2099670 RepID=A0A955L761_9BACT|nr:DUF4013 domain-containing protein [Candidatus Dojkabacteria bacterium]